MPFSYHYQASIDFNTVNIQQTKGFSRASRMDAFSNSSLVPVEHEYIYLHSNPSPLTPLHQARHERGDLKGSIAVWGEVARLADFLPMPSRLHVLVRVKILGYLQAMGDSVK